MPFKKNMKCFDAEIACFGPLLELYECKHSFVSVFDKHSFYLYEISAIPVDQI